MLAVGDEKIAIVSLDLGRAPTRQSTAAIREKVKKAAGIEHIFLCASHTHHGPVLELDDWPDAKKPYVRELEQKLADVILEANKALKPARLGVASKEDQVQSQSPLAARRQAGGPGTARAARRGCRRQTDRSRRQLRRPRDDARRQGAQVLGRLPRRIGGAGREGDRRAVPVPARRGRRPVDEPRRRIRPGEDSARRSAARRCALSKAIRCTAPEKATLAVREDDFLFKSRIDLSKPLIRAAYNKAFFPDLIDFYEREYRDGVRPHLTTALLNGNIGFVGVSGEFFCGHSLSLKRRARLEHVVFPGLLQRLPAVLPDHRGRGRGRLRGRRDGVAGGDWGGRAGHGPGVDSALQDAGKGMGKERRDEGRRLNRETDWRAFVIFVMCYRCSSAASKSTDSSLLPDSASNLPSRNTCGQIPITAITTSNVPIPPPTTDHTGPNHAAVMPDSNAPS